MLYSNKNKLSEPGALTITVKQMPVVPIKSVNPTVEFLCSGVAEKYYFKWVSGIEKFYCNSIALITCKSKNPTATNSPITAR